MQGVERLALTFKYRRMAILRDLIGEIVIEDIATLWEGFEERMRAKSQMNGHNL